eukprot:3120892-Rhodomonas_salina.3
MDGPSVVRQLTSCGPPLGARTETCLSPARAPAGCGRNSDSPCPPRTRPRQLHSRFATGFQECRALEGDGSSVDVGAVLDLDADQLPQRLHLRVVEPRVSHAPMTSQWLSTPDMTPQDCPPKPI